MTKASDKESVLICRLWTTPPLLPDNRIGTCMECKRRVQFRPDVPRMRKLCIECAEELVEPGTEIEIPQRVIDDIKNIIRGKQN